jgi:DNA-binding NtrC family response regulator
MSHSISTLLTRNLHDVFGENDTARRRAAVDGKRAGKKFKTIDKKALKACQSYAWPGNVRELQNVIERAVILGDGETFAIDVSTPVENSPLYRSKIPQP